MSDVPHPTAADWLAELDRQGKSPHTQASYRRALLHFARWSEGAYGQPFDPAAIIPRDVREWKAYQQTLEKAKPATINQRLVALSRYFTWALSEGHVRSDPTAEVPGLRREARRPKALDDAALRRLLRQVHKEGNPRDVALVELLAGSGLRVSEALALQRGDVTINQRSGEVVVRRGKGDVQRRVPLTAPVRSALRAYLDQHPELGEDDPLWVGQLGPLRDRSGVTKMLKKYARRAGLDETEVSAHVLRHTFATRYLAANPDDLRTLAAILGHASLDTVMIYTQPRVDDIAGRMARAELPGEDG